MKSDAPKKKTPRNSKYKEVTRERLLKAAIETFADKGFEGASMREIARRADVNLGLLPYYFESKEYLWKSAADVIFGQYRQKQRERLANLEGTDDVTTVRELLREFVYFSAEHPEVYRFIMQEGTQETSRMKWMVETHVEPIYKHTVRYITRAQHLKAMPEGRPEHFFMMIMAASASMYALAPEFRALTGREPNNQNLVEAHADAMLRLFFREEVLN